MHRVPHFTKVSRLPFRSSSSDREEKSKGGRTDEADLPPASRFVSCAAHASYKPRGILNDRRKKKKNMYWFGWLCGSFWKDLDYGILFFLGS